MDYQRRISAHRGSGKDTGQLDSEEPLRRVLAVLRAAGPGVIALSGGLDSRVLAHIAAENFSFFAAVHLRGPHVPQEDTAAARRFCAVRGWELTELRCDPLTVPQVRMNARDRCYHCKRLLFSRVIEHGCAKDRPAVLDGTNASDLGEYRPGLRALRELGVRSPLAEAGVDKAGVVSLGRWLGVEGVERPARPCLLTRFGYGVPCDATLLPLLQAGEALVSSAGFREFRLRVPEQGAFVLQLEQGERARWAELGGDVLRGLESLGVRVAAVRLTKGVSGWYDRSPRM